MEPLNLDPRILGELQSNLMLFFTGAAHHSWTILKEQEKCSTSRSTAVESLHQIRRLADRIRTALVNGDLHGFGTLLDEGWQAKKRVSDKISNSRIDKLYQLAKDHGAIGGKITGAGGGGFLLLYCESQNQESVRAAFRQEGIREMEFDFDFQGAHVVVNDPFIDGDERCGPRWTFIPAAKFVAD